MTTGASDSLGTGQSIDVSSSAPVHTAAISKQTLIIGTAILLAVLSLVVFRLTAHANGNGKDGSATNSGANNTSPAQGTDGTTGSLSAVASGKTVSNSSSVNIKLNSTNTTDSSGSSSSSELTVNGQKVPTSNGNVHYSSDDGSTHINISSTSNTNSGGSSD